MLSGREKEGELVGLVYCEGERERRSYFAIGEILLSRGRGREES